MNREILEKPFPPEQIKQRKGNFGKMLDYIEGYAVIQRLNDAFEGDWSFKIIHHEILKDSDEVIVIGELRAGKVIKNQFGSSQITRAKESKNIISLSDDLKAASTDCIKKAATLFGVGLHLYNNNHAQTNHDSQRNIQSRNNGGNGNGNGNEQSRTNGKPFQNDYSFAGGNKNNITPGGNGSNGNGRLTSRQYNYIMRLCDDANRSKPALDDYCVNAFGVVSQHLSRQDASNLISQLIVE